ncbi:MAG: class I SAM-dependent methyltransferase [Candidatus Hydrothermarchaeales archaeon]
MTEKALFTPKIYEDWMGSTQREKIAQIVDRVDVKNNSMVLDIGSGPGFLYDFVPNVVAVDVDTEGLRRNKSRKVLATGDQLPLANSSFDLVFCLDAVHLLSGVEEFTRVLKKDGEAVTTRYCSEYNKTARMRELKNIFSEWKVIDEFFVGPQDKELDAVIVCRAR